MTDDDLRTLFDIAVGSLDFGSGFLDDAEVEALRRVAVTLGVDPMEATPSGFRTKYQHPFRDAGHGYCYFCSAPPEHPVHSA